MFVGFREREARRNPWYQQRCKKAWKVEEPNACIRARDLESSINMKHEADACLAGPPSVYGWKGAHADMKKWKYVLGTAMMLLLLLALLIGVIEN